MKLDLIKMKADLSTLKKANKIAGATNLEDVSRVIEITEGAVAIVDLVKDLTDGFEGDEISKATKAYKEVSEAYKAFDDTLKAQVADEITPEEVDSILAPAKLMIIEHFGRKTFGDIERIVKWVAEGKNILFDVII